MVALLTGGGLLGRRRRHRRRWWEVRQEGQRRVNAALAAAAATTALRHPAELAETLQVPRDPILRGQRCELRHRLGVQSQALRGEKRKGKG